MIGGLIGVAVLLVFATVMHMGRGWEAGYSPGFWPCLFGAGICLWWLPIALWDSV